MKKHTIKTKRMQRRRKTAKNRYRVRLVFGSGKPEQAEDRVLTMRATLLGPYFGPIEVS